MMIIHKYIYIHIFRILFDPKSLDDIELFRCFNLLSDWAFACASQRFACCVMAVVDSLLEWACPIALSDSAQECLLGEWRCCVLLLRCRRPVQCSALVSAGAGR